MQFWKTTYRVNKKSNEEFVGFELKPLKGTEEASKSDTNGLKTDHNLSVTPGNGENIQEDKVNIPHINNVLDAETRELRTGMDCFTKLRLIFGPFLLILWTIGDIFSRPDQCIVLAFEDIHWTFGLIMIFDFCCVTLVITFMLGLCEVKGFNRRQQIVSMLLLSACILAIICVKLHFTMGFYWLITKLIKNECN